MSASIQPGFWRGKRVLLTGHTGFKGGWLALWLQSMGAELRGIALEPPTTPALFDAARIADGMDHCIADIRDFSATRALFTGFQPEIVLHLAAQPLVRYSYRHPLETYATNVMGTLHVLEAARAAGSVRAIVNVTTDKCYEQDGATRAFREQDPMGGHDPYSSSKGCVELASSAWRRSFLADEGIALATARAGNVIGGGDWAEDRLVPDVLRALARGEPVQVRSPNAIRPWQHVLEPLHGYLLLAQRLLDRGQADAEAWNFGPREDDARSVQWVVEHLCTCWGDDATWAPQAGEHPHEAARLELDIAKARQRLDWSPRWMLETALARTVAWQRAWLGGADMRTVTLEQISAYGNDA